MHDNSVVCFRSSSIEWYSFIFLENLFKRLGFPGKIQIHFEQNSWMKFRLGRKWWNGPVESALSGSLENS